MLIVFLKFGFKFTFDCSHTRWSCMAKQNFTRIRVGWRSLASWLAESSASSPSRGTNWRPQSGIELYSCARHLYDATHELCCESDRCVDRRRSAGQVDCCREWPVAQRQALAPSRRREREPRARFARERLVLVGLLRFVRSERTSTVVSAR